MEKPSQRPDVNRFRDLLSVADRIRFAYWRWAGVDRPFQGKMDGLEVSMRPSPSNDFATAYEIFFDRVYANHLNRESVARILDLGGNVGYSCIWWAREFPNAEILTFEPHPTHCALLRWHCFANRCEDRVILNCAAAGTRDGKVLLTDDDDSSSIYPTKNLDGRRFEVDLIDVMEAPSPDILKMDIEGAEYDILADRRFSQLVERTSFAVIEWHRRSPNHQGKEWCSARLRELGFLVESGRSCSEFGILRAIRPSQG